MDKLIILFFVFILFTGIYNDITLYIKHNEYSTFRGYTVTTIKSFFFLKYLFLYFSIKYLIKKDFLSLKFFFITCSFASVFVCLDILFQLNFGRDVFGFEAPKDLRKLGGPFGDEFIAGGFIQDSQFFPFF